MAIRDYWIYQKRDVPYPWALYIVKEYDRMAGKRATVLDFTFYHEAIPNATHSTSKIGLHHEMAIDYVNDILAVITDFTNVANEDVNQLTREISNILAS